MAKNKFTQYFKRHRYSFIVLIAIILLGAYLTYGSRQMINKKNQQLESLLMEEAELKQALELLEQKKQNKSNEELKESLARKKLNMIKPDELIYVIKFE